MSDFRRLWDLSDVKLLTSEYALDEAQRNLEAIRPERLADLYSLAGKVSIVPQPSTLAMFQSGIGLHGKDLPILLAAIEAHATHLLTGDKKHFGKFYNKTVMGVFIIKPREFLKAFP
jgi:uncharacterized protein